MNGPLLTTIAVALVALACELIIMILLQGSSVPYQYVIILDSVVLALILSPILYFLMYKPMKKQEQSMQKMLYKMKSIMDVIPVCDHCEKINVTHQDSWIELKNYLREEFGVKFISTSCPYCNQETCNKTSLNS